jgi:hypothetical protein
MLLTALLIPWIFQATPSHACRVPEMAVIHSAADKAPTHNEARQLEQFSQCICGPEGATDYSPQPLRPPRGRTFYGSWPSCNRYQWNGRRYVRPRQ